MLSYGTNYFVAGMVLAQLVVRCLGAFSPIW